MALRDHGLPYWTWRVVAGRPRLFIGLLCGLAAAPLIPGDISRLTRVLIAWDFGVVVFLASSAFLFTTERLDRMPADAAAQEEGEWTIFWLTVAAVTFSFAAIIDDFSGAKSLEPTQRAPHVILVAVTLLVSWLMTHTTFAFRYAHEYYERDRRSGGNAGGLDFPHEPRPDYLDFLYFSLVLGMTFQVSDVQITSRKFRRMATVHGLLSFLFNTIILALTVNMAASGLL